MQKFISCFYAQRLILSLKAPGNCGISIAGELPTQPGFGFNTHNATLGKLSTLNVFSVMENAILAPP